MSALADPGGGGANLERAPYFFLRSLWPKHAKMTFSSTFNTFNNFPPVHKVHAPQGQMMDRLW